MKPKAPTESELKKRIKLARKKIAEWEKFLWKCKRKLWKLEEDSLIEEIK